MKKCFKFGKNVVCKIYNRTDINNIIVSRGLSVEDVLQSSISLEEGLNEAISNKAFEVDKNILAGPVQGPFGPTLIYVTKIESSIKKTFLEVKPKKRNALAKPPYHNFFANFEFHLCPRYRIITSFFFML